MYKKVSRTENLTVGKARLYNYNSQNWSAINQSMAPDQAHDSMFQWSEKPLRNDDRQNNSKVIVDVWLNVYGKIYWLTSSFLIIPNA